MRAKLDVLIDARLAASLLGATRMDRPEDVQPNPVTGKVYVNLTYQREPRASEADGANPRANNEFGHIIELDAAGGDHAADVLRLGHPGPLRRPIGRRGGRLWNPETSANGWFACPDNSAVDAQGRLWVATDQGEHWGEKTGRADGLYALETEGARRRTVQAVLPLPGRGRDVRPLFHP